MKTSIKKLMTSAHRTTAQDLRKKLKLITMHSIKEKAKLRQRKLKHKQNLQEETRNVIVNVNAK